MKKILAFLLLVSMTLSLLAPASALEMTPQDGVGLFARQNEIPLGNGLDLHLNTLQHVTAGQNEERYLEYAPGSEVVPMVVYGSALYGMSSITYVSDYCEAQGNTVLAGVNGDFYMTDTGIPIGIVVTNGILRTSDIGRNAVGFYADGSAFIGIPSLEIHVSTDTGVSLNVDYLNKTRKNYGTYLLTSDYSSTTRATDEGTIVVLNNLSGSVKVGGTITATVESIYTGTEQMTLTPDRMVITATKENGLADRLSGFTAGANVTISVTTPDVRWSDAVYAVGAGDTLVAAGQKSAGLGTAAAPRTALGITAEGKVIAYTVDGRQSGYSSGMSLDALADRMLSLGCVEAVNLDGGGSTVMMTQYPGESTMQTVNKPSDGKQRKGANFLLFVNKAAQTADAARLHLYPFEPIVLAGASFQFTVKATDAGFYPAASVPQYVLTSQSALGSIDSNGLFTAGTAEGQVIVTAEAGALRTSETVTICTNLTAITLVNQIDGTALNSISADINQAIDLSALCYFNGSKVISTDTALQWSVENHTGEIGTVDASGSYTASDKPGSTGYLSVKAGGIETRIPVTVGSADHLIDTFEQVSSGLAGGSELIHSGIEANKSYVRYGNNAGRIVYDFSGTTDEALMLTTTWKIPAGSRYLKFWLCGDNSGNIFGLTLKSASGTVTYLPITAMDFAGFMPISIALPSDTSEISALYIRKNGETAAGTVYLDQMTASYTEAMDNTPPDIEILTADGTSAPGTIQVHARVLDNGYFPALRQNIDLLFDGAAVSFAYDETTCLLTASMEDQGDGKLHRITIKAADIGGNLATASFELNTSAASGSVFADTAGHWSEKYAEYLNAQGVINGTLREDGRYFYPDSKMTRAEFAVMMTNFLRLDPEAYADTALPYLDADRIPEWAVKSVAAMYENGVIMGKSSKDGLKFDPVASITRAEVMTILGRTLPKGFVAGDLSFTDSGAIPAYADEYVGILVNMRVVTGYSDSTIRPNNNVNRSEAVKMLYGLY